MDCPAVRAVLARLADLGYSGRLSIEYFDLPDNGWPLDDPAQWARDLAAARGVASASRAELWTAAAALTLAMGASGPAAR